MTLKVYMMEMAIFLTIDVSRRDINSDYCKNILHNRHVVHCSTPAWTPISDTRKSLLIN